MGLINRDSNFIYIINYSTFAFLSLFASFSLLFSSEKKEKKKISTLHPNHNTHHSGKADESGGMQGFELFGIGEEHDYSK